MLDRAQAINFFQNVQIFSVFGAPIAASSSIAGNCLEDAPYIGTIAKIAQTITVNFIATAAIAAFFPATTVGAMGSMVFYAPLLINSTVIIITDRMKYTEYKEVAIKVEDFFMKGVKLGTIGSNILGFGTVLVRPPADSMMYLILLAGSMGMNIGSLAFFDASSS